MAWEGALIGGQESTGQRQELWGLESQGGLSMWKWRQGISSGGTSLAEAWKCVS